MVLIDGFSSVSHFQQNALWRENEKGEKRVVYKVKLEREGQDDLMKSGILLV